MATRAASSWHDCKGINPDWLHAALLSSIITTERPLLSAGTARSPAVLSVSLPDYLPRVDSCGYRSSNPLKVLPSSKIPSDDWMAQKHLVGQSTFLFGHVIARPALANVVISSSFHA